MDIELLFLHPKLKIKEGGLNPIKQPLYSITCFDHNLWHAVLPRKLTVEFAYTSSPAASNAAFGFTLDENGIVTNVVQGSNADAKGIRRRDVVVQSEVEWDSEFFYGSKGKGLSRMMKVTFEERKGKRRVLINTFEEDQKEAHAPDGVDLEEGNTPLSSLVRSRENSKTELSELMRRLNIGERGMTQTTKTVDDLAQQLHVDLEQLGNTDRPTAGVMDQPFADKEAILMDDADQSVDPDSDDENLDLGH